MAHKKKPKKPSAKERQNNKMLSACQCFGKFIIRRFTRELIINQLG